MEYLVRFTSAEGREGHHNAEDLDTALQFAERVRNTEEATDVQVYRLQPVPIRFKACYKVEVEQGEAEAGAGAGAVAGAVAPTDDAPSLPEAPPAVAEDGEDQAEDALVNSAAGRRLFTRT